MTRFGPWLIGSPLHTPRQIVEHLPRVVRQRSATSSARLPAMQDAKMDNGGVKKLTSACDVDALKKCLEENNGNYVKCQAHIEAFKSSCSIKRPQTDEAAFGARKD